MGEDLINRRNERFATLRDLRYTKALAPDLFSTCPASTQVTVIGEAIAGVSLGLELWAKLPPSGSIDFYAGDVLAVSVDGASADHLRREHGPNAPLVATILAIEAEEGLVRLGMGCAR